MSEYGKELDGYVDYDPDRGDYEDFINAPEQPKEAEGRIVLGDVVQGAREDVLSLEPSDEQFRMNALSLAIKHDSDNVLTADELVRDAKAFDDYIRNGVVPKDSEGAESSHARGQ